MIKYYRNRKMERLVYMIIDKLNLSYIKKDKLYVVISIGSKTRACARIYGMPRIFSYIGIGPAYVIELISECIVKLPCVEVVKLILHELMHIPLTFSGALRPHGKFTSRANIDKYIKKLNDMDPICNNLSWLIKTYRT